MVTELRLPGEPEDKAGRTEKGMHTKRAHKRQIYLKSKPKLITVKYKKCIRAVQEVIHIGKRQGMVCLLYIRTGLAILG